MAGKAIMKPSPRSRARVETAAWTDGGVGGWWVSPRAPAPLDTIQSEQSGVAVSTFSSASKCQAVFAPEHTRRGNAVRLSGHGRRLNRKNVGTKRPPRGVR